MDVGVDLVVEDVVEVDIEVDIGVDGDERRDDLLLKSFKVRKSEWTNEERRKDGAVGIWSHFIGRTIAIWTLTYCN